MIYLAVLLCCAVACTAVMAEGTAEDIEEQDDQKVSAHSLLNFGSMIDCALGRLRWTNYVKYGCYCGKGGKGTPKDATDRCCEKHDACYGAIGGMEPYWKSYKHTCSNRTPKCNDTRAKQASVCKCDVEAAKCFKRNRGSYNKKYVRPRFWLRC